MPEALHYPSLAWAHPLVRDWFLEKFGSPTEPQEKGWPEIVKGRATLISAPTGSGKTLTAFLACIDRLVRKSVEGRLENKTEVVYVSPLKALSNDIQKNLEEPLAEIFELAEKRSIKMLPINTAVRTGDTLQADRRSMLKTPPHILVTTPESLYILLTAEKSRANLQYVETLIVDEIHAVADDKRGAHLSLSMERLERLCRGKTRKDCAKKNSTEKSSAGKNSADKNSAVKNSAGKSSVEKYSIGYDREEISKKNAEENHLKTVPVRIGLSATQKPIETVAQFLVGNGRQLPVIVDVGHRRKIDVSVLVPDMPLAAVSSNEQWEETYDKLAELVKENRSTIIFVNTRRLAEKLTLNLAERLSEESVAAHHGSLSRKLRHQAEKKLKNGELQALVATASLELGIDVGSVDLVCLVGSPRSIAVALQRIGRAGHWRGAIPKGRIFPGTRDELLECAALVKAIRDGDLDKLQIPDSPMDILAQQIVAMASAEDWTEEELYKTVKAAYPYGNLSKPDFYKLIEMLAEGISARRGRYSAYLLWNRVEKIVKGRRGARLAAITSGGAIPETGLYSVVALPEETNVGTVDEDFAIESMRGDVFLLGNTSWRIHRVESARGRVLVEDAHGAAPTIPFWFGEAPGRTEELSFQITTLRKLISEMLPAQLSTEDADGAKSRQYLALVDMLKEEYGLDRAAAEQAIEYVLEGRRVLGTVPTHETVVAERFFDEGGGMQLIIHSPFGARINKAWGLALRKCFCRSFNFELQASATDNGLNISLGEQHSFPLADVFNFLSPESVKHVLEQASLASPIFTSRFRWDANRSLMLLRFQGGKKVPPYLQRLRSEDLLAAVFPQAAACQDNIVGDIELPDHPLINEVMKDVLTEALDLPGLTLLLEKIASGSLKYMAVDTPLPSAFSHEILNANPYAFLDDAPLEERRARAVELRRSLPENMQEVAFLDPKAVAQVEEEAWPDLRDCDELHDLLQTLVALPEDFLKSEDQIWHEYFDELRAGKRAAKALVIRESGCKTFWLCAERKAAFDFMYPDAVYVSELAAVDIADPAFPGAKAPHGAAAAGAESGAGAEALAVQDAAQNQKEILRQKAMLALLNGWFSHTGPVSASELSCKFALDQKDVDLCLLQMEASGIILRGQFRKAQSKFASEKSEGVATALANSESKRAFSSGTLEAADDSEWCHRRLLARIHKLTVTTLRKGIEPLSPAQFMNWLLQWQHLAAGTQVVNDERGTLEVISQLQGLELPANAWESMVLAKRIKDYDREVLDRLCLTGKVGWGRLSPHPATLQGADDDEKTRVWRVVPTSVAPIAFFLREESDWMPAKHPASNPEESKGLSHEALAVRDFLKQRGASFFADIVRATNRLQSEVENGLWELVAAGLVTADGFDNLRALIDPKRRSGQGRGRSLRPRHSTGRWSLLYVDEVEKSRQLESICRVLLFRYGVVFRDLLARESIVPRWRDLLITFRRLEDRGEIRGGRFVSGFIGEQFALPEALESLRHSRSTALAEDIIMLSAADPLNLIGIIIPGKRTPATSSSTVMLKAGAEYLSPSRSSSSRLA